MPDTTTRTDIRGNPIVERRHWSFSAVDQFTNCPRRFKAYQITKEVKEPESPQMKQGLRVHKAMAEWIEKDVELPADIRQYADWKKQFVTGRPGERVYVEQKYAFTFELEPCEYFDRKKKVWNRSVADLVVVNGSTAQSVDWKTGEEKDPRYELLPPNFQLKVVALAVFLNYPQVDFVESSYVYLPQNRKVTFGMWRKELREFVPLMYDIVGGLQRAVRADQFPPRKSGLCKRHCGVLTCEHNGLGANSGG